MNREPSLDTATGVSECSHVPRVPSTERFSPASTESVDSVPSDLVEKSVQLATTSLRRSLTRTKANLTWLTYRRELLSHNPYAAPRELEALKRDIEFNETKVRWLTAKLQFL